MPESSPCVLQQTRRKYVRLSTIIYGVRPPSRLTVAVVINTTRFSTPQLDHLFLLQDLDLSGRKFPLSVPTWYDLRTNILHSCVLVGPVYMRKDVSPALVLYYNCIYKYYYNSTDPAARLLLTAGCKIIWMIYYVDCDVRVIFSSNYL